MPTSVYLHIPFCRRRCYYCDFPVSVVGDRARGETNPAIADYVNILCQEIKLASSFGAPLQTVFLGGGTPSLLAANQVEQLLQALDQQLGLATNAEISLEVDPGTFTLTQLQAYRAAGVNRLSLGAQAFQDQLLADCGRSHTVSQIEQAVEIIQQAGFSNFSLDLISGLPGQSLEQWQASLDQAIALMPTHLSAYDLVLEPGTVFGKRYQPEDIRLPTDHTSAQMYRLAGSTLAAAGYQHYEISNYAQAGWQCRHNRVYWLNQPYYGFGMGATSYITGQRFSRPRTRREYYEWIKTGAAIAIPAVTLLDEWLETLMLGLRLSEGLALADLQAKFSSAWVTRLQPLLAAASDRGWLKISADRIYLTDPEGFLFSNQVLRSLWQAFD
ncbi:MAG: radical SAM family heme chaperone HemW [Aphanocapsa sp. GSE-SYN-MK-11-07L]|nr:radical SAM family heme chaperone HemW [Aphanocapsa sp. GSE-SYN-MK-11-07L]